VARSLTPAAPGEPAPMAPPLLHPLIVGHRGMTGPPENSLEAFAAAIALGVDAVELDVRRTADGRLVAWHDERLPSGEPVAAVTAAHARETVPHLALVREVAEACEESGVTLQIDLKEVGGEVESVAEVERVVGADRLFVTTLEDVSVRTLKRARPDVRVGLSLGAARPGDTWLRQGLEIVPWRRVARCGPDLLSVQHRLASHGLFLQARALGFPVFVWTVDDPARMDRLMRWRGLAGLISNRPDLALAARRRALGAAAK
jgi:glycerophosphoryl diester phosphodiesterase